MNFLARLVSDNSGSLEKLELRALFYPPTPREKFLHGIRLLVRGYLRVRFDLPSSINFTDISSFPKLGLIILINPYCGSPQMVQSGTIGFYVYDFLLVINCTWGRILHRYRDSLRYVQHRYIWLPLLRFTPDGGQFPWDDLRKVLHDGQRMRKISTG